MLDFPGVGSNNKILEAWMNNELINLCEEEFELVDDYRSFYLMDDKLYKTRKEMLYDLKNVEVSEELRDNFPLHRCFPEGYPVEKMIPILIAFYSLLKSDKEYIPTLIMEYIMASMLESRIEFVLEYDEELQHVKDMISTYDEACEEFGEFDDEIVWYLKQSLTTADVITKEVYKEAFDISLEIEEELFQEFGEDDPDYKNEKGDVYRNARLRALTYLFPCSEWLENYCFWDYDFDLLNYCKEDDLRNSCANDVAGIMPKDSEEDEYIVPEDWVTSTKFRFVSDNR